jgi:hypothetical protein
MSGGISEELVGVDLGDVRSNQRSGQMLEALSVDPEASVNASHEQWSDTLAAYRVFDNPKVTPEAILPPHRAATLKRMAEQSTVVILQDTTKLEYSKRPPRDGGCLTKRERVGFYLHPQLATTPAGLPLRLMSACAFEREAEGPHADFVIRSKENRRLDERVPPDQHDSRNVARNKPARFPKTIGLPGTTKRSTRQAELEVRAEVVTLKHPKNRRGLDPVDRQVVHMHEIKARITAIQAGSVAEWRLLTSLPIETQQDIERVLDYDQARWTIEVFFRVLKSGCRVEELQLETTDRLKTCLAFCQIIAWFTLRVTHLNRELPDPPCSAVFTDSEWEPGWRVTTGKQPPPSPPPLTDFVPRLASLGGYNNRKTEPPPGPQPIRVGVRRMHDFARAWESSGPNN